MPPNTVGKFMSPNATGGHRVIINCLLLKAVPKSGIAGKEENTLCEIGSCDELKDLIKKRPSEDITVEEFDVGYFEGSNILRIRSKKIYMKFRVNFIQIVELCDNGDKSIIT